METELAAINDRLDLITSLLPSSEIRENHTTSDTSPNSLDQNYHVFTDQEKSPFQLLGSECLMTFFGLDPGFAGELLRLEKDSCSVDAGNSSRLRMIQHQQALDALAAFSTHVHGWYPILRPGFSERYLQVISGPLLPHPESCLMLLIAATGILAQQDHALGDSKTDTTSEIYFEAALASLPLVLTDSSIVGVQCLILLSIYHCCLCKPCQAYDYIVIASFKVQNMLKAQQETTGELYELLKRAYWTVLLLESELRVQFGFVESGIWNYDDHISLPDGRRTWQFDVEMGSPATITTSPASMSANPTGADLTKSYYLAEIAMRRMLHRCNTAIRRTKNGEIVYAPAVASELELQLDEWYGYLPEPIRFDSHQDIEIDLPSSPRVVPTMERYSNFLRVQYYCCKISIYWPAVYQCIQNQVASPELLGHCQRFFNAYIQLIPSILASTRDCMVNRWMLYASIFMTTMAVVRGESSLRLRSESVVDWDRLHHCFAATLMVDKEVIQASPSLSLLHTALREKLTQPHPSLVTWK